MQTRFAMAAIIMLILTIGWGMYWQSTEQRQRDRAVVGFIGMDAPGRIQEAQSLRRIGLWVGGVGTGALLLGTFLATPPNRRKCPRCAEDIAQDARVCKHCQHELA